MFSMLLFDISFRILKEFSHNLYLFVLNIFKWDQISAQQKGVLVYDPTPKEGLKKFILLVTRALLHLVL